MTEIFNNDYDPLINKEKVGIYLNKLYYELDQKEVGPNSYFSNDDEREQFESKVNYSYNKFENIIYHFQNVIELNNEIFNMDFENETNSRDNRFSAELDAFLLATRSCIDLLSEAANVFLKLSKGSRSLSIYDLIKNKRKDLKGKIRIVVTNFEDWINTISRYRNPIVHTLSINTDVSREGRSINDIEFELIKSTLIPKVIPDFIYNTRKNREQFLSSYRINDNSIEEIIPDDFIAIEDFMEMHFEKLTVFYTRFIEAMIDTFK